MPVDLANNLGSVVAAIGGLGTASFALVDVSKIGRNGGVSNSGFSFIEGAVRQLFPNASRKSVSFDQRAGHRLLNVLHGNWINGAPLGEQKAIAKSLVKLALSAQTAENFAAATGVDSKTLSGAAASMTTGASLTPEQTNVLGRFDLALTAILDEGYQRADQRYRNSAKVWASIVAMALAILGGWTIADTAAGYFWSPDMWKAGLCGLLATPLAPISKDLTSALAAGVKVAQSLRK
jgi:hypothetical protein